MKFEQSIAEKMNQWDREAEINAVRAIRAGRSAVLIQYPTGLKMMRFAEPFSDFGMHYEIQPETWLNFLAENDLTSETVSV